MSAPMTDRNYLDHVVRAIAYRGNRFTQAWLMARGSYAYTCSFSPHLTLVPKPAR